MIATKNQQAPKESLSINLAPEIHLPSAQDHDAAPKLKNLNTATLLPNRVVTHNPKAGLNPLVDAAGYLFSVLGKLKHIKSYRQLGKLQKELIQEINTFQETIKNHGYNAEYVVVCRYIMSATFDDIIANTNWGSQSQWEPYSLINAFNQDAQHQDKFFTIMERTIKEPALYIDLMELMYICLSMGYKGQYRATEHNHFQLEQITSNLYKHIRAYRGSFSKSLSPTPLKTGRSTVKAEAQRNFSPLFIFCITACIIMTIFVSLGYLMDVISNEAYKNISQVQNPLPIQANGQ